MDTADVVTWCPCIVFFPLHVLVQLWFNQFPCSYSYSSCGQKSYKTLLIYFHKRTLSQLWGERSSLDVSNTRGLVGIKHNRAFQYEMIDMFHSTVGLNGTQRYDEQGNPLYLRFSTAHLIINPTHQAFPNENEWGRGLKLKQSQYDLSGSVYFHMGGKKPSKWAWSHHKIQSDLLLFLLIWVVVVERAQFTSSNFRWPCDWKWFGGYCFLALNFILWGKKEVSLQIGMGPEQVGEDMLRSDEELGPKLEWAKLIRMAS